MLYGSALSRARVVNCPTGTLFTLVHVSPWSKERFSPPSLPRARRLGARGIDEQRVMVDVHAPLVEAAPGAAAVGGAEHGHAAEVEAVGIRGIDVHAAEVVAVRVVDLLQAPLVRPLPGRAAVVAAEHLRAHDLALEQVAVRVLQVRDEVGDGDPARLDVALERARRHRLRELVARAGSGRWWRRRGARSRPRTARAGAAR